MIRTPNPFNVLTKSKKINENENFVGDNGFQCDTKMKKNHHPKCSKGNMSEKQERIAIIEQFFEHLNASIHPNSPISHLNQMVEFLNTKDSNLNRWIYRSFERNPKTNAHEIINMNLGNKAVYRQKKLRNLGSSENIKRIKNNMNRRSFEETTHPIQFEIRELFENTHLKEKIRFNFDFLSFQIKIREIRDLPILENIKNNYGAFVDSYSNEIIEGEKSLKKIFGDELYSILKEIGILDELSIKIYNRQYVREDRESAHIKLKIWLETFVLKIEILSAIMNDRILTKEELEEIIKTHMLNILENYLFFCNYVLREHFEKREFLLEWAYEALYYNTMGIYFDFIDNFLNCNDTGIKKNSNTKLSSGTFGETYKISNKNQILKEMIDTENKRLERIFFEFFKQLCLYKKIEEDIKKRNIERNTNSENVIPEPIELIFGKNKLFIKMQFVQGVDSLKYYIEKINSLNITMSETNKNIQKKNILKDIFDKISTIILNLQNNLFFVHGDLNLNNVMIHQKEDNTISIYIIDVDISFLKYENLFILNYYRYTDISNLISKNEENKLILSNFAKSIDLLRFFSYFCYIGEYYYFDKLKKKRNEIENTNINKYNLDNDLVQKIKNKFFGSINTFPNDLKTYFDNTKILKYKNYFRVAFTGIYKVRQELFNLYIKKYKIKNKKWINYFYLWENTFNPLEFKKLLIIVFD